MRAIVEAVREQPGLNARYDDEAGIIHRHGGVHGHRNPDAKRAECAGCAPRQPRPLG